MNEKDLKIQALLERVAQLTQQYENQVADYRVSLTQASQREQQLQERVQELEAQQEDAIQPKETEEKS